jgi:hypothetical protein
MNMGFDVAENQGQFQAEMISGKAHCDRANPVR